MSPFSRAPISVIFICLLMIAKLGLCLTVATSNLTVVLDIDQWLPSDISRSSSEMLCLNKPMIFFSVQFAIIIICIT